jgi:hypothetical protein
LAVERALSYILRLQPEGTYILTSPGVDDVVHMDVAHSAIALAKTGHLAEARGAMDWLLGKMTVPGDLDENSVVSYEGQSYSVDYAGSWWDHFTSAGVPKTEMTRGRAEGVGMGLIATYALYQQDPEYLAQRIGGHTVADLVGYSADYLTSPSIQGPDGRFSHRPDYRVSFNEEGARMVLGLRVASQMLSDAGRPEDAAQAAMHADLGLAALLKGQGLSQGMAYDYYAMGIWGLVPRDMATQELAVLNSRGLVTPDGVRNYDWQVMTNPRPLDRLRYWLQGQTIGPSETFDWAIANVVAGQAPNAVVVEQKWLGLQRPDGGFPGGYIPVLGLPFGDSATYSAARFVMLERILTAALGGA